MLRCVILCLLCSFAGAHAAETKLYQWTDENGVVHFTSEPPPEQVEATERSVREIPKAGTVRPRGPASAESAEGSAEESAEETATARVDPADEERLRRERCEQGRAWVAGIEPADRIRVQRPDGSVEFLQGEDRIAELERARKMVAENCQ